MATAGPSTTARFARGIPSRGKPFAGGAAIPFFSNLALIEISSGGARPMYSAAGSVVPGAGSWAMGFCAQNQGGSTLNDNGNVNGWVMVTN